MYSSVFILLVKGYLLNLGAVNRMNIITFLSRYAVIIILWLLGLIVSYGAFSIVNYYEQQHNQQQFEAGFRDKVTSISQAILAIDKVFLATHSMLDSLKGEINHQDFANLINRKFLANTGLQGIEWAPAVSKNALRAFESDVRKRGLFDYQISSMRTADSLCKTSSNKYIFPVLFAEPADVIGHELGMELSSDCKLSSMMFLALNTRNTTHASFYNEQGELGLRLLLPVFNQHHDENSGVRGYIIGIVMMNQLIDSLWGNLTGSTNEQLRIYNFANNNQIIYDSSWRERCEEQCEQSLAMMSLQTTIPFDNQLWSIELQRYSLSARGDYYGYSAALIILLVISAMTMYLLTSINRVSWANALVAERTKSLQYQANHDDLTQLLNRQALSCELARLNKQYSRRSGDGFSLLFIDLDHFKKVNDTKGHLTGDKLLQQVAQRLKNSARDDDLLFRFGGDEFVVLLPVENCPYMVAATAKRILNQLEQVYVIEGERFRIGASIGITTVKNNNTDVSDMLRNADIAMYEAKRQGRGKVVFYQTDMYDNLIHRQNIENDLEEVIQKDGLSLYLQPIHNLNGLMGFEALSRWHHPEKGIIFPDDFISVAEETGLIHQLGRWLIDAACQCLAAWLKRYSKDDCPYISINVSPLQLANSEIVMQIKQALVRYQVPANLLAIELTESALIDNKTIVKDNLLALRALKIRVFLDDFGTGYSSLSLLQDFPIDVLKIDRSFISGIDQDNQGSKKLVKAMITMAHALNMKVVAEGVETVDTLRWLTTVQCNLMQGYYFSKPLPDKQATEYLVRYLSIGNPLSLAVNA